jgi:hypothetical protein
MAGGRTQRQQAKQDVMAIEQSASLENHLRLQQSQEDFIKWLEASEVRHEIDQYSYKKIR